MKLKTYTEAEFTRQVVSRAKLCGWLCCHFRPSINRRGKWQTPIQGDKGFPDALLCRGNRVVAMELKMGRNKPTLEQLDWLVRLSRAGVETYVLYPKDWDTIERILA